MANLASQTLGYANSSTPIQDFTPEKQSPAFSGPVSEVANIATYTGTTNTLTAADCLRKLLILTNAGAITATLPTAALLIPAVEGGRGGTKLGINAAGGSSFEFYIKAGGAGAVTVSAGTGGTLVGSGAITAGSVKQFLVVITDASVTTPAYTIYSFGQAAA